MSNALTIQNALISEIQGLGLVGINSREIQARKTYLDNTGAVYRGITLVPVTESQRPRYPVSGEDIGYNWHVYFATQNMDGGFADNDDRVKTWRETVRQHFINQRLTGVDFVYTVEVFHRDIYIPREHRKNRDVGTLAIRCWVRELRS